MRSFVVVILLACLSLSLRAREPWMDSSMGLLQAELTARYGPDRRLRVQRGLAQAARFWRAGDGGAGEFEAFVRAQFAGEPRALDALQARLESAMASLDGHLRAIGRDFRPAAGPALPVDALLAGCDPGLHLASDGFDDKLAFAVLLNFPLTTLPERLRDGGSWTRGQWAQAWLADRFSRRAPAGAERAVADAFAAARDPAAQGGQPEPDGRCRALLEIFQAERGLDPFAPTAPTFLERSFDQERQLPEARVRQMLETVCGSPLAARTAGLIRGRLGRPLEPLDLRYDGFRPGAGPDAPRDLPGLLRALKLPVPREEHPLAAGLPGPPFAEAIACLAADPGPPGRSGAAALDAYWRAYGEAGAALVEIAVWHWLYEHPTATAGDLRTAVAAIALDVWDRYYGPVLGGRGGPLLAEAGALAGRGLQSSDRPIGRMIAFQIRRRFDHAGGRARTLERCARLGRLTPDLWLARATGGPLEPGALLEAAGAALEALGN